MVKFLRCPKVLARHLVGTQSVKDEVFAATEASSSFARKSQHQQHDPGHHHHDSSESLKDFNKRSDVTSTNSSTSVSREDVHQTVDCSRASRKTKVAIISGSVMSQQSEDAIRDHREKRRNNIQNESHPISEDDDDTQNFHHGECGHRFTRNLDHQRPAVECAAGGTTQNKQRQRPITPGSKRQRRLILRRRGVKINEAAVMILLAVVGTSLVVGGHQQQSQQFSCVEKAIGYYADLSAECQVPNPSRRRKKKT
jgi:hypothetical protein